MKKEDFLKKLRVALKNKLKKEEIVEIISDYNEYFDMGNSDGKTEEELIMGFGDPDIIAKELLTDRQLYSGQSTIFDKKNILKLVAFVIFIFFLFRIFQLGFPFNQYNIDCTMVFILPLLLILSNFKGILSVQIKSFAIKRSIIILIVSFVLFVLIGALIALLIYKSFNLQSYEFSNERISFLVISFFTFVSINILSFISIILILLASFKWSSVIGLLFYLFGAVITELEIRNDLSSVSSDYQQLYDNIFRSFYPFAFGITLSIIAIVVIKLLKHFKHFDCR